MNQRNLQDTWDLTHLYADNSAWYQDAKEVDSLTEQIVAYKDKMISSAEDLYRTLNLNDQLGMKLTRLAVYAKIYFDQDMGNSEAKAIYEKSDTIFVKVADQLAFMEPKLLELNPEQYQDFVAQYPNLGLYNFMMDNLFQNRDHVFTQQIEEILSKMSSLGNSFEKAYDDLTVNDIDYPEIPGANGAGEITADNTNYAIALIDHDRDFRKRYFEALMGTYQKYTNTITSAYYGSVKNDVFIAQSRKYKSARNMALSSTHIPEAVYDNLIATVKEHIGPLQEYIALRKEALGLDTIHFYDLFVPLVEGVNRTYTYEEAKELVLEATAILGEDYTATLKEAFDNRWIDVYPGKNKATGAYAIDAFGHHPYSLLNFTGTLNDVFTIAHELGHVMHSYYSNENQPYTYSDYTIFTAEVASTVNEQLLFHHLLKKSTSDQERALLLSNQLDNIRSTLFRQTLFADFEYQTHKMVEEGTPLLPDSLAALHCELYKEYHGEGFVIDDILGYEWSRIPHFYRAFYVYQYSTGVSAAVSIANQILEHGASAVANYRKFLTMGGSNYSIELLKIAGVDMTTPQPIIDTIQEFHEMVGQLRALTIK